MSEKPFNPLEVPNVAFTLALELIDQPLSELPPGDVQPGSGVYALYYYGDSFEPYRTITEHNRQNNSRPIYVGKAVQKGSRKGIDFSAPRTKSVLNRLRLHAKSIGAAENLKLADFKCRFLVTDDAFIGLAESVLISVFQPLWNQVVDGFGNNPTGGPRSKQAKSDWDVLHPGRIRGLGEAKRAKEDIENKIRAHLMKDTAPSENVILNRIAERLEKYLARERPLRK